MKCCAFYNLHAYVRLELCRAIMPPTFDLFLSVTVGTFGKRSIYAIGTIANDMMIIILMAGIIPT